MKEHDESWDGTHIETLGPPTNYSQEQIAFACGIQRALQRGKLVLAEPPRGEA